MADSIPDAMQALQQESRKGAEATPQAAAEPLNKAAQAAAERAEAMGGKPEARFPRMDMPTGGNGGGRNVGEEEAVAEGGYEANRLRDWLRLSGDLGGTVMDSAEDGEPEDYRGLIRKYFEEVSRRSHDE